MLITPIRFQVDVNPNDPIERVVELLEKARNCTLVAESYFRGELDEEYVLDYWAENEVDVDSALDICENNIEYVFDRLN